MKKPLIVLIAICCLCCLSGCDRQITDSEESVTLRLACWIEDMELQQLVKLYEETHENVNIEVIAYYSEDMDVYAAMDRMNADLISGEYADLYYLENAMDVMSLVRAGLLADLYPIMESDSTFEKSAYFSNVWELLEMNGSLYEIPSGFQIGAIVGPESLLGDTSGWTIQEFQTFAAGQDDPSSLLVNHEIVCFPI